MSESPPLRASDAERDQVAASLREHCIAGRLTLDEFAERTDQALAARTKPELDAVTRDLPSSVAQAEPKLGKRTHVTLIGGMERRGPWRLPERLRVVGVIGAVELDLSEAVIEAGETTIDAWWGIGSLEIVVPEGIEVEVDGFTLIGAVENESPGSLAAGAPRIRVRHFSLVGATEISVRRVARA